jgi:tetratricopeptide (TPR) repeat protein
MEVRTHALGAVMLLLLVVGLGCGDSGVEVEDVGTRAVVIGIDGADWKIIEGLIAEGGMPNLAALRARSAWGPIETLHDIPLSPVIWTSVATGKSAAKHGVSWFMVDQPDGTRVPVRSHNRKAKAIWNILAENERRPSVIGWWATYPAEEVGDGLIVSDGLGFHGFGSTARGGDDGKKTYPAALYPEVSAKMPAIQQITSEYATRFIDIPPEEYSRLMYLPARSANPNPLNPIHLFQQYAVTAEGYTSIAEDFLRRPFDLLMVYFEQVDSFSHLFIKYQDPKLEWVDEERQLRFRNVVSQWYRYQDELLGRLLAEIDLDTTAVFILSDHGFKSGERRIRSESTIDVKKAHLDHETQGIFLAAGPNIREGAQVAGASVMDITPTLLHYLGFPIGQDMDGKVLDNVFLPEFMESNPIRYLDTYELVDESAPAAKEEEYDGEELEANMKALEALGYVGSSEDEDTAQAIAEGDSSPELHSNMGRIHLRNGELDKARVEFEKALELNPNYSDALLNIGEVLRLQGRVAEAEHFVKRALRVDPNSIGALAQLGEIKRDMGDLDEAIRLFQEGLAIDDSYPFVFLGLGDVLQRAGRYEEAEEAFRRVLQLNPDSFKAYYNLGVTLANRGQIEGAVENYEKALEIAPNHPESAMALNNMGAIYLESGEIDKAAESFERAVRTSPVNLESRYNLATIYLGQDRVEEAIQLLEHAAKLQPNHEQVTMRLAMSYMRVGRNDDAYKSFLLIRRLYPQAWQASLGLALLHANAGQPEQAKGFLSDAFRVGGQEARAQAAGYPLLKDLV